MNNQGIYKCVFPNCQTDPNMTSKKKYFPICGCYYLCATCYDLFFPQTFEERAYACIHCGYPSGKDMFFPLVGSLIGGEEEEYEKANNRVNKVFNHSRDQFDSLEKYNQYQENKLEIAYKLFAKVELKDMEACLSSFELNNRNTIAENNANPRYDNKNAYIIEEFKRVSKNKLQRERLVDRYYRSYIDEKGFATESQALMNENNAAATPVQNIIASEIKDARAYSYTPNISKAQQQQANQEFQFPKPVIADPAARREERDLKLQKFTREDYEARKVAGGWTSNMVASRCKENAFKCLFV